MIALGDEFRANATSALREMIRQHYNHPSVIMWGYMNEAVIQLQYRVKKQRLNGFYENTLALARHLEETLKREDPYRLSTMAYHAIRFTIKSVSAISPTFPVGTFIRLV